MKTISVVSLLLSLCVLRGACSQDAPYSFSPVVVEDSSCPSADAASQMTRASISSNISSILYDLAAQISNETAICPKLDNPAFGSVTWTGRSVGSNVTYTCDSGYNLVGSMTRVCELVDVGVADWGVEAPICEPICSELNNPAFGTATLSGTTVGSTATYACNSGYILVGNTTRMCEQLDSATADWSRAAPICEPICSELSNPAFGAVTLSVRTIGSTATYTCNSGYIPVGTTTRTCEERNIATADWSGTAPICEPLCPLLSDPASGTVALSGRTVSSTATYTCNNGYSLMGITTRVCQQLDSATADWHGEAPICEEIPCLDMIYVMGFTSGIDTADSNSGHAIRVVIPGQDIQISLPNLPADDQTLNKGDLWKMDFVSDFGFRNDTCPNVCNIESVAIVAEGADAWIIDSIVTYGCTDGGDCSPLTQDFDVERKIQDDGEVEHLSFTLTNAPQPLCT